MKKAMVLRIGCLLIALAMLFCLGACSDDSSGSANNGGYGGAATVNAYNIVNGTQLSDPNLRYVMIYNPKIFDENSYGDYSSLTFGALGTQVDVFANRGDGLDDETEYYMGISQDEWLKYLPDNTKLEGDRAEVFGRDYALGTAKQFYYSPSGSNMGAREKTTFFCQHVGTYCYIWAPDFSVPTSTLAQIGKEFDEKIYSYVVQTFGDPRFVGTTGKINLLFYPMEGGLLGYFALLDLFTDAELPQAGLSGSTCNTGDAILNINSLLATGSNGFDLLYSTLAHELQHLINFSAYFDTVNGAIMNTWLNEAMSGFIEAELYTNSKELSGQYVSFNNSALIRNGQSLYNFKNQAGDIGVYGSVYYFTKYLERLDRRSVFSSVLNYWRDSYSSTLTTHEALAKSVTSTIYDKINNSLDYSSMYLSFATDEEEWVSKLCLNFYLSMLSNKDNIAEYSHINNQSLLYDSMDGAKIEGGGRVIVALSGTTFEIPAGSDRGLLYIGLDRNFNPITDFVYK